MKKNLNDVQRKEQYGMNTRLMGQFWKPESKIKRLPDQPGRIDHIFGGTTNPKGLKPEDLYQGDAPPW